MPLRSKLREFVNKLLPPQENVRIPRIDFCSGLEEGAWILYGLVRSKKPQICVEIGSARGQSTCFIGLALKHLGSGKLYAIDPHAKTEWNDFESEESLDILNQNLRVFGVTQQVNVLRNFSKEVARTWNQPIDLLFIDGDHSYEGVKSDWDLFFPFLTPFSLVIFHDTLWDLQKGSQPSARSETMGVPRFVDELRASGFPVVTIDQHYGISITQPVQGGAKLI